MIFSPSINFPNPDRDCNRSLCHRYPPLLYNRERVRNHPLKICNSFSLKLNKLSFRSGSLVARDVTVAVGKSAYRADPIPLHSLGPHRNGVELVFDLVIEKCWYFLRQLRATITTRDVRSYLRAWLQTFTRLKGKPPIFDWLTCASLYKWAKIKTITKIATLPFLPSNEPTNIKRESNALRQ